MGFKFIESDEPLLYDDMYELVSDTNIYIQKVDECGEYIVRKFIADGDYSHSINLGRFDNLEDAKQECIKIFKGVQ